MGSGPQSLSGDLCFHPAAGPPVVVPVGWERDWGASFRLSLWPSSSAPPLPVLCSLEAEGDPEGPQAQPPAPEEAEHGAVSWAQTLTLGCRLAEAVRGSRRGLKTGLAASSCSADAEPGQQEHRLARPLRLLRRLGIDFGVI